MGQPAAWMMANTQGSFFNNGELYLGDPVSARKTADTLSARDDNIVAATALGGTTISLASGFTGNTFSLSTNLVDKCVNYAWVF
jgi:hypothetical protein